MERLWLARRVTTHPHPRPRSRPRSGARCTDLDVALGAAERVLLCLRLREEDATQGLRHGRHAQLAELLTLDLGARAVSAVHTRLDAVQDGEGSRVAVACLTSSNTAAIRPAATRCQKKPLRSRRDHDSGNTRQTQDTVSRIAKRPTKWCGGGSGEGSGGKRGGGEKEERDKQQRQRLPGSTLTCF